MVIILVHASEMLPLFFTCYICTCSLIICLTRTKIFEAVRQIKELIYLKRHLTWKQLYFFYLSPQIGWFLLNTKELKYFIGDASYKTKRYICFIIFIIKDRLFNDKLNNYILIEILHIKRGDIHILFYLLSYIGWLLITHTEVCMRGV